MRKEKITFSNENGNVWTGLEQIVSLVANNDLKSIWHSVKSVFAFARVHKSQIRLRMKW